MTETKKPTTAQLNQATKSLGGSLLLSAVRCTLQYIVFPFFLPLLGLTGAISSIISLVLSLLAVGIILYNIVELWSTSWRWRYLGLGSVMLLMLIVFLADDLRLLLGIG
ncbi:MAG: hypothetical protein KF832_28910 [Caldilineaceae bacterium]|nr:hypothetical protein [Caldilineaceae bacterium]